jgi:hypothetical protein
MSWINMIFKNATKWLMILSKMRILGQPSSSMTGSRSINAFITSRTGSSKVEAAAGQPYRKRLSTTRAKECFRNPVLSMKRITQEQQNRSRG